MAAQPLAAAAVRGNSVSECTVAYRLPTTKAPMAALAARHTLVRRPLSGARFAGKFGLMELSVHVHIRPSIEHPRSTILY
jgi:hypothetical protein